MFVQATLEVTGFSLQVDPPNISVSQQEIAEFILGAESLGSYEGSVTVSDVTGRIGGLIVAIANPNLTVPGGQTVVGIQSSK
jgi:hypothetical protein